MGMRKRTSIAIGILAITLLVTVYVSFHSLLANSFEKLEATSVQENVGRFLSSLSNDVSDLRSKTNDYAAWDETYNFMVNPNNQYIAANLADPTFTTQSLNLMLFINSSGQIVYGKAFDIQNATEIPVPESVINEVSAHELLWRYNSTGSGVSGIVLLPENPMLIASEPILTSQHEGPVQGALIMGRYLDSEEIDRLAQSTHLSLTLQLINDSSMPSDFQAAIPSLSDNQTVLVRPLNADFVAGYVLVNDVYGNPILISRIQMFRDIYKQGLDAMNYFIVALLGLATVFVAAILILMETTVLHRVVKLTSDVRKIGKDKDLLARVSIEGNDELSVLAQSINGMLSEIKDKTIQLRKTEHLAATGQVAAMVGHDLRNPLTGISGATYYLKTKLEAKMNAREKEMVETIERAIAHSDKIISDLLKYAEEMKLNLSETEPKSILSEVLPHVKVPNDITILDKTQETPRIKCDQEKMKTVFAKLVENAVDAMPNGGTVEVECAEVKNGVAISFSDTGVGIPSEIMRKLWSPLFTTKAKGMGLGLPICKRIVEAHGGTICAETSVGKGSKFTVMIPTDPKIREEDSETPKGIPEHPLSILEKQRNNDQV
jgi:sensor domain CHASE-containing protein/nitrogen-specific signal transduction histidine kinase